MAAQTGKLIALEGIDGCGKSTQARLLATAIGAQLTHEPGATSIGSALRNILLSPTAAQPSLLTEALLMAADRAQHVEEIIRPALAAARWVVTDRYSASTLAYQGYGRGIDQAQLRALIDFATSGLTPDLNILVDVPLELARQRVTAGSAPDRLERLGRKFHQATKDGFTAQAASDPQHWYVVDGTAPPEQVHANILRAVTTRLGHPPPLQ